MTYLFLKGIISGALVVGISELAKRYSLLAALLASLPITSLIAFIWMYLEERDSKAIAVLSEIVWLVIPSLALFFALHWLLLHKINFWLALLLGCALTAFCYALALQLKQWL